MPRSRKLIVANWKAYKSFPEGLADFLELVAYFSQRQITDRELVCCPAYPFLARFREELEGRPDLAMRLGSQDISRFEEGAYTGEVSAKLLSGLVDFAIIGHSERRQFLNEDTAIVNAKLGLCQKYGITPIVCVSSGKEAESLVFDRSQKLYLAFEPLSSIGTGAAAETGEIRNFYEQIKPLLTDNVGFLYGGSVKETNLQSFKNIVELTGVLVGTASLKSRQLISLMELYADDRN